MQLARLPVGIAFFAIAALSPLLVQAQPECRLIARDRPYSFASDVVDWTMTIGAGQSCVRGIRSNDAVINDIQLATPPKFGKITLQENSFYYQAPDFPGEDGFVLSISGRRLGISGSSTIQVVFSVR
jgi:hypothetical protein